MINLSVKEDRDILELQIQNDINDFCIKLYDDNEHRKHLGASIIGKPCSRDLWYTFRWCKREQFTGRMLRLFNVGHQAEPRFVSYLRGIGFEVKEIDEATNKQFRMTGCKGHYGGSLDAMLKAPSHYNITEDLIFLGEFKTNNTGAGFTSVAKDGVAKAKPRHYAQACQYGYKFNLKYSLYMIENKNDSDITIKIVPLDLEYGRALERKAENIIFSQTPPEKISEQPSYYECKYCTYNDICHHGEKVETNCRSCRFAEPTDNKQWYCHRFKEIIPDDFIVKGCDGHLSINE